MLWRSLRRTARRDMSIATLLSSRIAVLGQSSHGSSMFCHAGTPRSTIYALDRPANNMITAVNRTHKPSCALGIGNEDDSGSDESPPPRPPGGFTGGGGIDPVLRSSVITGITSQF